MVAVSLKPQAALHAATCVWSVLQDKPVLPLQSLRRRIRPGQRPPSRFQAEAAESQAQGDSEPPQVADTDAAEAANPTSLVAAWDPLELSSMMRQVSPAVHC